MKLKVEFCSIAFKKTVSDRVVLKKDIEKYIIVILVFLTFWVMNGHCHKYIKFAGKIHR